eukprot:2063092-Prymnesium_polylepis.1
MQDYLRDQPQEVTDIDLVTEAFHFLAAAETEVDSVRWRGANIVHTTLSQFSRAWPHEALHA